VTRPPYVDDQHYSWWKNHMENYIQDDDYELWMIIKNGSLGPKKATKDGKIGP